MLTKEQDLIRKRLERSKLRQESESVLTAVETRRNQSTRTAYAEYLQRYYWEDFYTVTFRNNRREPYYAAKSVWSELKKYNITRTFIAVEPFQSGDLHVHGLAAGNLRGWLPEMMLPWDIWGGVFKRFGISKVEACNSPLLVANYCAKYILKQQSRVCDYYYFMGDKFSWVNGQIN